MLVYFLNLINAIISSLFAMRYSKIKYVSTLESKKRVPNTFFVWIIIFSFMSVYALRWYVGTDFGNYYYSYNFYKDSNITELIGSREWGFNLIAPLVNSIAPNNYILYNYVLAGITYIPVVLTFRKYSSNFVFSIILYITTMGYYFAFNGVRQGIAISLCFAAFPLLYNKRYLLYSLIILVAYLFHSTALIMIPLSFIITKKAWSKGILVFSSLFVLIGIFLPSLWSHIISFLELIGQEKMASDYNNFNQNDDGVNLLRILVAGLPLVLSLLFYKKMKVQNVKVDLIINFALVYVLFMLLGLQSTVLARLASYFSIFNVLLIPEIARVFKGKNYLIFMVLTLVLYFIYMITILPVDSNLLPYRFIFKQL